MLPAASAVSSGNISGRYCCITSVNGSGFTLPKPTGTGFRWLVIGCVSPSIFAIDYVLFTFVEAQTVKKIISTNKH